MTTNRTQAQTLAVQSQVHLPGTVGRLLKQIRDRKMVAGRDIGVISYNDTPLKELLGITVISTDFETMGETAAYMILKRKKEVVKNVFRFINRDSI